MLADCTSAAAQVLGPGAEVLKCGHLNSRDVLEAVAIQRKHKRHGKDRDIFAARLVILRQGKSGWTTALDVSRGLKNDAGYIATDYIDNDAPLWGYRVKLHDTLPDDRLRQFTVEVAVMHDEKDGFSSGTEISWDRQVGRYREYNVYSGSGAFQPESRNPPSAHPGRKPVAAAAAAQKTS
jgi:hypothetical protein